MRHTRASSQSLAKGSIGPRRSRGGSFARITPPCLARLAWLAGSDLQLPSRLSEPSRRKPCPRRSGAHRCRDHSRSHAPAACDRCIPARSAGQTALQSPCAGAARRYSVLYQQMIGFRILPASIVGTVAQLHGNRIRRKSRCGIRIGHRSPGPGTHHRIEIRADMERPTARRPAYCRSMPTPQQLLGIQIRPTPASYCISRLSFHDAACLAARSAPGRCSPKPQPCRRARAP